MSHSQLTDLDVVMVVAVAENGVIGRDNAMPWQLKSDLARFKSITTGRPIVMGRKTYESLGRPLPGRTNIVITRDPAFRARGALVVANPEEALTVAAADAERRGVREIMIIGGGQIYARLMPQATRIELTEVHAAPEGDAVFPQLDKTEWRETSRERHEAGPQDSAAYSYVTFCRV